MPYSLQNSINYAGPFIQYAPLNVGTGFEPATSIATGVRNIILNAPFKWPWNRNEFPITLAGGTQDYIFPVTDFAYLEKVSLLQADGNYGYEIHDIYNTDPLGIPTLNAGGQAQPNAVAVKSYIPGVSVSLRFLSVPDQAYTGTLTYQQLVLPFNYFFSVTAAANAVGTTTAYTGTFNPAYFPVGGEALIIGFTINAINNGTYPIISCSTTMLVLANQGGIAEVTAAQASNKGSWAPIPDSFIDIYNALFLAEAFAFVDDARSAQYRQRGIAALLSKAEGLSELQINAFLAQWQARERQGLSSQMRAQMGSQARGI